MFHISCIRRALLLAAFSAALGTSAVQAEAPRPTPSPSPSPVVKKGSDLVAPLKDLFSHKKHQKAFQSLKVTCVNCHQFASKSAEKTEKPLLTASLYQMCHRCHQEKVALPAQRNCNICHRDTASIQPKDHFVNWRQRHGRVANQDRDSCNQCHTPQGCSTCHSKIDIFIPIVHSANFRLFHSIEARANPRSCISCHRSGSFCTACHTRGR